MPGVAQAEDPGCGRHRGGSQLRPAALRPGRRSRGPARGTSGLRPIARRRPGTAGPGRARGREGAAHDRVDRRRHRRHRVRRRGPPPRRSAAVPGRTRPGRRARLVRGRRRPGPLDRSSGSSSPTAGWTTGCSPGGPGSPRPSPSAPACPAAGPSGPTWPRRAVRSAIRSALDAAPAPGGLGWSSGWLGTARAAGLVGRWTGDGAWSRPAARLAGRAVQALGRRARLVPGLPRPARRLGRSPDRRAGRRPRPRSRTDPSDGGRRSARPAARVRRRRPQVPDCSGELADGRDRSGGDRPGPRRVGHHDRAAPAARARRPSGRLAADDPLDGPDRSHPARGRTATSGPRPAAGPTCAAMPTYRASPGATAHRGSASRPPTAPSPVPRPAPSSPSPGPAGWR